MRLLVWVLSTLFSLHSVALVATSCDIIGGHKKGLSTLRLEKTSDKNGRLSILGTKNKQELEVTHVEGKLKESKGLLAFAGESGKNRLALMVQNNQGTVSIKGSRFPVVCHKK